jgi:hypothetical protein
VAVERRKVLAHAAQIDKPINRPQQVVLGHMIIQRKLLEQRRLSFLPWPHHR